MCHSKTEPTPNSQNGFVLLMVLVFLHIFSLLGLYALMKSAVVMKVSHHQWRREEILLIAENRLQQIEKKVLTREVSACMISAMSATALVKKPLAWWKQYTCSDKVNGVTYYYIIESLGQDPCSMIEKKDEHPAATVEYYRITLLALTDESASSKHLLQSTVAKAVDGISSCSNKVHTVTVGRQTWREI